MNIDDDKLALLLADTLEQELDSIDELTAARLRQARMKALEHASRPPMLPRLAPAIAFATSCAVLAILLQASQGNGINVDIEDLLYDIEMAETDLELIEELDFYRWLDANGYAG